MSWIISHLQVISTLLSLGTLIVWVFYAQLLYIGFRRNERPLLLIHQALGQEEGSFLIVVNLGRQPIHVVTVDLILHLKGGKQLELRLNEYTRITGEEEANWASENVMKEGPLRSGDFLSLGGFHGIIDASEFYNRQENEAREHRQQLADDVREIEIWVSALANSFNRPIGARRTFSVHLVGDRVELRPLSPITTQKNSIRQRYKLLRWLRDHERVLQGQS